MFSKFYTGAALVLLAAASSTAPAQVVISQVYGGAGCGTVGCSTYKNDYIEIFNRGASPVSVNGWSVQYASATGTSTWQVTTLPDVSIGAGSYLLIAEGAGANGVSSLPTPDVTGAINMSGTAGKVALLSTTTALSGACPASADIQDKVGYGATANCVETAAAPAPSTVNADFRANGGCTDSGDNSADFAAAAANPRNSGTSANVCSTGGATDPTGSGAATPAIASPGGSSLLTVTVAPGTNPDSTGLTVSADLSAIGGSATQTLYDDGSNGDATAGDNVFSFNATVDGATATGKKSLAVAIADAQARSGSTTIALTVSTPATIMQIQGSATTSPLAGETVTTSGNIVTALKSNGFFMQDPVGDADVATSDGIFVFTSSAPTVAVGDAVTVTGKVQEFGGSTELSNTPVVAVASTGNALPPAYVLDANPPTNDPTTGICTVNPANADTDGYQASNFACLDGMLVAIDDATVTGATFASGADGVHTGTPQGLYAMVTAAATPFRGVGALYPGLGAGIPVWNGEPEVVELYFPGLPAFSGANAVYNAGTRFSVTGIVQGFKSSTATAPIYEIYPAQVNTIAAVDAAALVQPVADSAAGTLTIGTQNLLHFFNDQADGADTSQYNDTCAATGNSDSCPTTSEYNTRLAKAAKQICSVLKSPAVLEIEEIENQATLANVVAAVSAECQTGYLPYVIPGNDPGGINIGLLVRSDVTFNSLTQIYRNVNTVNCSGTPPCLLNDRPPLLLDATYNGYRFAVLAIYDRSLSGLGDPAKPYVGPKRAEQAAQIAQIVQAWQSGATLAGAGTAQADAGGTVTTGSYDVIGDANVPLIVTGDFNAYEFNDGYADVTGMIMGSAVQSADVYWYTGNAQDTQTPSYVAPSPTLVDSGIKAAPTSHYSYNFSGMKQEIDHILLSRVAWKDFVAISNAHGNADVSEANAAVLDAATPARSADHDGQVLTLAPDRIFADDNEPQP